MKRKKKIGFIIFIIFILLSACGNTVNKETVKQEPVNIYETKIANMYGMPGMVSDDKNIYCLDVYGKFDSLALYKIGKTDDKKEDREIIETNVSLCYCLYNNKIFWSNEGDNGYLYCTDLETNNSKKISDFICDELVIFQNEILYLKQGKDILYSMNIDGSDQQEICSDCSCNIFPYGDKIFYCSTDYKIKSIDWETKNENDVLDLIIVKFFILNDMIYFIKSADAGLYKKNLYNDTIEEIEKACVIDSTFNICDNLLIYCSLGKTYSYDINTGIKKEIYSQGIQYLNVINQKIIFLDSDDEYSLIDPYIYNYSSIKLIK